MDEGERSIQVARVNAGDPDALQRLIVHYHPILRNVVLRATDEPLRTLIEPDDVLQLAYIAVFKTLASPADNPNPERERGAEQPSRDRQGATDPPHFDNPGHFYKWLEQITLNQLRDVHRALRRQKRDVARRISPPADTTASYPDLIQRLAAGDTTPSRHIAKDEAIAAVLSCLARLKDDQREVVRLRFLEDLPVARIAQRLGKTDTAVYTLCHRGLKSLRELMVSITHYLTKL